MFDETLQRGGLVMRRAAKVHDNSTHERSKPSWSRAEHSLAAAHQFIGMPVTREKSERKRTSNDASLTHEKYCEAAE